MSKGHPQPPNGSKDKQLDPSLPTKILVVEDDPDFVFIITALFKRIKTAKFDLHEATSFEEANLRLSQDQFNIILLDLHLPDSSGVETVEAVKKIAPSSAIVVMTSMDDAEFATKALQMGAQDYLVKGEFNADLLTRSIKYSLERQALKVQLEDANSRLLESERQLKHRRDLLEEEVSRQTRTLEEEKIQFKTIIDLFPSGVLVLSPSGEVKLVNQQLQVLLDQIDGRGDGLGGSVQELISNPVLSEAIINLVTHPVCEAFVVEPVDNLHLRLNCAKASLDREEEPFAVIVEIQDISDYVRFEQVRKSFFTTASHELRTPITALYSSAKNLEKYGSALSAKDRTQLQETIIRNSELLAELSQDLLEITRLDEKKVPVEVNKTTIGNLFHNVNQLMLHKAEEKGIKIQTKGTLDYSLIIDVSVVEQILRILLDNAIKYTLEGGTIVLEGGENPSDNNLGTGVLLSVKDNGLGIEEKDLPYLFQRFYRGANIKNQMSGSGLGLSIAEELVRRLNGNIWVTKTQLGVGTTFSFFVPC